MLFPCQPLSPRQIAPPRNQTLGSLMWGCTRKANGVLRHRCIPGCTAVTSGNVAGRSQCLLTSPCCRLQCHHSSYNTPPRIKGNSTAPISSLPYLSNRMWVVWDPTCASTRKPALDSTCGNILCQLRQPPRLRIILARTTLVRLLRARQCPHPTTTHLMGALSSRQWSTRQILCPSLCLPSRSPAMGIRPSLTSHPHFRWLVGLVRQICTRYMNPLYRTMARV